MKQKEIRTTLVDFTDYADPEFKNPSRFYIKSAIGYLFIHVKNRTLAQEYVNNEYGYGFYVVRCIGSEKTDGKRLESGGLTAR